MNCGRTECLLDDCTGQSQARGPLDLKDRAVVRERPDQLRRWHGNVRSRSFRGGTRLHTRRALEHLCCISILHRLRCGDGLLLCPLRSGAGCERTRGTPGAPLCICEGTQRTHDPRQHSNGFVLASVCPVQRTVMTQNLGQVEPRQAVHHARPVKCLFFAEASGNRGGKPSRSCLL